MLKARLYVIAFDGTGVWKITSEKKTIAIVVREE